MKKHDLISLGFLLLAGAGAILVYFEFSLVGQIAYTFATMFALYATKLKAAMWQGLVGLVIACGFGYVTGDWMHSVAVVFAYLGVTLRIFAFQNSTFTSSRILEPVLSFLAIVTYITSNLIHDNGWQGWCFPVIMIALCFLIAMLNLKDRIKVNKLLEDGLIKIGSIAPDFSLESQDGGKISLSDYKGQRDVLLIFVRGDWCPSCHIMLRLYEKERQKFQDKNVMLFAIGPDPVGVNRAMVEKLGVEFAVLSDDSLDVSRSYCLELQTGMGKPHEAGIPLPASFLIDKQGMIRYTSRADNAGEFLSPELIFDVLAKI